MQSVIYHHAKLMMAMNINQFSVAVGTPSIMFVWKVQHVHYEKKQLTRKLRNLKMLQKKQFFGNTSELNDADNEDEEVGTENCPNWYR